MHLRINWCVLFVVHVYEIWGLNDSCIHNGMKYNNGDYFTSNDTFIKTDHPGQCVQCKCHDGLVICEVENCPTLQCETPVRRSQYCCPQCPGVTHPFDEPSDFVFILPKPTKKKQKVDCISGERFYENGSIWQPVMGPFGVTPCVECRCDSGRVVCQRFKCKNPPCSHPKKELGQCCAVCPLPDNIKKGGSDCLPVSSELFVYQISGLGNSSEIIEYAFFENRPKNNVAELHTWDTRLRGRDVLRIGRIPKIKLSTLDLKIIGATSFKNFKKYSKKEQRLEGKCITRCAAKVLHLLQKLRLYHVITRNKCNSDEIDIKNI